MKTIYFTLIIVPLAILWVTVVGLLSHRNDPPLVINPDGPDQTDWCPICGKSIYPWDEGPFFPVERPKKTYFACSEEHALNVLYWPHKKLVNSYVKYHQNVNSQFMKAYL